MPLSALPLLHVDDLAVRIQGTVHANFLSFELLHFVLMVDVIGRAGGGILKHVLVALLYHRAGESLSALIRLGC